MVIMDQAVQDRIRECRFCECRFARGDMPLVAWQLARDDRRGQAVTVFEDLQDVLPLAVLQRGAGIDKEE
jgi:hypothetical protein